MTPMKDVTPNSKLMWKGEALCLSVKVLAAKSKALSPTLGPKQ